MTSGYFLICIPNEFRYKNPFKYLYSLIANITKPLTNVNCDDASLDDEDDERFFMAVLSIAITEEDDFELCRLFCEMLNELCGGVSFNVIFAANPTLFEEVINVFIAADVSGGSYNNRACKFVCN